MTFALTLKVQAEVSDFEKVISKAVYVPSSENLSFEKSQALSAPSLALYMAHAAQKYNQLFNDPEINQLPLQDRYVRIFVQNPLDELDTLYQIDVRVYSPSYVGNRYNRMVIIRPYTKEEVPCILYTHGNGGNLNTWYNFYLVGVSSFLHRGYAVAFYENYNNSFFSSNSATNPIYKDWVHHNLADSTIAISDDHVIQRGYYVLYQYAHAAHQYLSYLADEYNFNKNATFVAGHSAGALSSLMLSLGDTSKNFKHPLFEYSGTIRERCYDNIHVDEIPIKGVLSTSGGLPDSTEGTYYGDFLKNSNQDIAVVMVHGAQDPLASVDYGKALWGRFVDTVKLMGPLSLHTRLNALEIKNYSFINCTGVHAAYTYPFSNSDNSGVFRNLAPFSYDYQVLSDDDYYSDTSLNQILMHFQQMDSIIGNVSKVFSRKLFNKDLTLPSAIYSWQASQMNLPIQLDESNGYPVPTECNIPKAKLDGFNFEDGVPTSIKNQQDVDFKIYPNPSKGFFVLESDITGLINIFDMYGKKVFSKNMKEKKEYIEISKLSVGSYVVVLYSDELQIINTERLVIVH